MALSPEHQLKLRNAYLRDAAAGVLSDKVRRAMDYALEVDPDFVGELRQSGTAFQTVKGIEERGLNPQDNSTRPAVVSGLLGDVADSSIVKGASKALSYINPLDYALSAAYGDAAPGYGYAHDVLANLADPSRRAKNVEATGAGEVAARIGKLIPGARQALSSVDTDAGPVEQIVGTITGDLPLWLVNPALGVASAGAQSYGAGGNADEVIITSAMAKIGHSIGAGVAPKTLTGVVGTEVLGNALPAVVQSAIENPDITNKLVSGEELSRDDKAVAASALFDAALNTGVGVAGGAVGKAMDRRGKLRDAGFSPDTAQYEQDLVAEGNRVLSSLAPEELDAKLAQAENDLRGVNPIAVDEIAANRDRLIRKATKEKSEVIGKPAELTVAEYRDALLRGIDGEETLYRGKAPKQKAGKYTLPDDGKPRSLVYDQGMMEARGDDPALYAYGHKLLVDADAYRAAGDEARAAALEAQGAKLKQVALRPRDEAGSMSRTKFQAALKEADGEGYTDAVALGATFGLPRRIALAEEAGRGSTPGNVDEKIGRANQKSDSDQAALDYWADVMPEQRARAKAVAGELKDALSALRTEKVSLGSVGAETLPKRVYDLVGQLEEIQAMHPNKDADHELGLISLLREADDDAAGEVKAAMDARNRAKRELSSFDRKVNNAIEQEKQTSPYATKRETLVKAVDDAEAAYRQAETTREARAGDLKQSLSDVREAYNSVREERAGENKAASDAAKSEIDTHYANLREGAKDIAAKEKQTVRDNLQIGGRTIDRLIARLSQDAEKSQGLEARAETKVQSRDLLSQGVRETVEAGGVSRAKAVQDYQLNREIASGLADLSQSDQIQARVDIDKRRAANMEQRKALEAEREAIIGEIKTARQKRAAASVAQRGIPAREAKTDPTNAQVKDALKAAAETLGGDVDLSTARLDDVNKRLAASLADAKLIDEDARSLGRINFESPDYPQRRADMVNKLLTEKRVNTIGQADALVRNIEKTAASQELERFFDRAAIAPERTIRGIDAAMSDAGVSIGADSAQAVGNMSVEAILSRRQNDIDRLISIATRGVDPSNVIGRILDKTAAGASLLTNVFGTRQATLQRLVNKGGPTAYATQRASSMMVEAANKAQFITNALRSIMHAELNPDLGTAGNVSRGTRRALAINPMSAIERDYINTPGTRLFEYLESGDIDGLKSDLAAFAAQSGKPIKDVERARLAHFAKAWDKMRRAAGKGMEGVGVTAREKYFPRYLSDEILDMLRKDKANGERVAKEITKQAAREAPDFPGNSGEEFRWESLPRYQQVYNALMDAIVDPNNPAASDTSRRAAAASLRRQMNLDPLPADAKNSATLDLVSDAPSAQEREVSFPEWITDDNGNSVPVVSRDLENIAFKYAGDAGRVISGRSTFSYGDGDFAPDRLADTMATIPPDSLEYANLLSLYRDVALGKRDGDIGIDTPYLGRISSFFPGDNRIPSGVQRFYNGLLNIKKPLMVSGSLFSNLLSYSRLLTDARGLDAHMALIPGLRKFTNKKFLGNLIENNLSSTAGMARAAAQDFKETGKLSPAFKEFEDFAYGIASEMAQQREARIGEDRPDAAPRWTETVGNVIGEATAVNAINRYINHVASRAAIHSVNGLVSELRSSNVTRRNSAAWDLENVFGITDIERLRRSGASDADYATAARSMRARANGVDRTALETPSILRSWLTRKLFSLQSVAMIQGANFALDIERLRASGALSDLGEGRVMDVLTNPALKKTAAVGLGLVLAGLYREALSVFMGRSEPTESPATNLALTTLAQYGYVGSIPSEVAYAIRLQGSGVRGLMESLTGGAPVEATGVTDFYNLAQVIAGAKGADEAARKAVPIYRNAAESFDGTWTLDNVEDKAKEFEREARRLRRTGSHIDALDPAYDALNMIERGKRLRRLRAMYGQSQENTE